MRAIAGVRLFRLKPSNAWGVLSHRPWPGTGSAAHKTFLPTCEDLVKRGVLIVRRRLGFPVPMSSSAWLASRVGKHVPAWPKVVVKLLWKAYRHRVKGAISKASAALQV
jgi:hypothetical protein